MAAILDRRGNVQQIPVDVSMYRMAADNDMTFPQWINSQYDTNAERYGSAFEQLCASEGIILRSDREYGIRASTMDQILNGRPRMEAGVLTKDAVPTSRIVFPAAILSAIENQLLANLTMNPIGFNEMVAVDDSIANDRFIRPVLNYSNPNAARSQVISQLSYPSSMLGITVSEVSRAIPTRSLGIEWSEQAVKNVTLDLTALAIARAKAQDLNARVLDHILYLLNGDPDLGTVALSTLSGKVLAASSFDSTITTSGVLTQTAWMKYLWNNGMKRKITNVVTDINGALAIQNRLGRPTIFTDNNQSPRINTEQTVVNPLWEPVVEVFITVDPRWPANTIMGFDKQFGVHRVTSTTATYEAIETFVLKRGQGMRIDNGEVAYRLFDDAFDVLTLN